MKNSIRNKISYVFLALVLIILMSSCSNKEELSEFLKSENSFESPVREYGSEEVININAGNFLAYIVYPKGDLNELDKVCKNWANETLEKYRNEMDSTGANLVISYNSHIVEDKYVVVGFHGEYYEEGYAHPVSFVSSFNANRSTGELLSISDFLTDEEIDRLKEYVIKEKKLEKENVDEDILSNWRVAEGGIEIILEKGKYLPESEGTIKIFASFDMLKNGKENVGKNEKKKTIDTKELENIDKAIDKSQEVTKEKTQKYDKVIALTFDDGPGSSTARLLDILKKNNVKATFFVLGSQIDSQSDLLPRMIKEGHEIGGHSWTHRSFVYLSDEELIKEIMQTRAKISSLTGVDTLIVRPPYGAVDDRVQKIGKTLGVHFVNWDVDTLDWKTRDAQSTYKAIINEAKHGNIVLCHDIHSSTVDAMENVIKTLLDKGYHFVTVSELLNMREDKVKPGEVYFNLY